MNQRCVAMDHQQPSSAVCMPCNSYLDCRRVHCFEAVVIHRDLHTQRRQPRVPSIKTQFCARVAAGEMSLNSRCHIRSGSGFAKQVAVGSRGLQHCHIRFDQNLWGSVRKRWRLFSDSAFTAWIHDSACRHLSCAGDAGRTVHGHPSWRHRVSRTVPLNCGVSFDRQA